MSRLDEPPGQALSKRLENTTMASMFLATAADCGNRVAVRSSDGRVRLTYDDLLSDAQKIGAGFRSAGLRPRDTVGLMLRNRPEFHKIDIAALCFGATPFSLYNTSSPEQLGYMLNDANTPLVVCEREFLQPLLDSRSFGATFKRLVVVDGASEDCVTSLDRLIVDGAADYDLFGAARQVSPDDVLTLVYTSGSTGLPKGVELTHANLVAQVRGIDAAVSQAVPGRCVSFMPSAHIGDRARWYYGAVLTYGHEVTTIADPADLMSVWKSARPTLCSGVPRIWEKVRTRIEADHGPDIGERARNDPALGQEIRAGLGLDEVRWFTTGSAPTHPDQFRFFDAIGIQLCELWGMTETCAMAVTNTPTAFRYGSVGKPIAGLELRVASDGELLARGPTVTARYRNRPAATKEALDPEGWFRTGDIGHLDDDGFVWITGRKKDVIINASGKNMSPTSIESALKEAGQIIGQACVIGDRRPYNVALIVVGIQRRPDDDPISPEMYADVQSCVDKANARLSRVEQIKRFALLTQEWLPGGDELTPTMKLKRREIAEKYAVIIEDLYRPQLER